MSKGKEGVGIGGGFVSEWRSRYGLGGIDGIGQTEEAGGQGLGREEVVWRVGRCWAVLEALGPEAWGQNGREAGTGRTDVGTTKAITVSVRTKEFASRPFASLSAGEQSAVLLMRALVGRPPLVLLDEVWSGMEAEMIEAARRYLRGGDGVRDDQAVVVITHWEDEVPWGPEDGVQRFRLEAGNGWVVDGQA